MAGSASLNSLSNISQRNPQQSSAPISSTSSAPTPAPSSTAAPLPSSLISDSFFSNALSQALASSSSGTSNANPTGSTETQQDPNQVLSARYSNELRTMREMGLYNELINLQALAISNGDVEAAINLVLSGLGSSN